MNKQLFAVVMLSLTFAAGSARADLMITIPDGVIAPGGSVTLDALITSNSTIPPDQLGEYNLVLRIERQGTTISELVFRSGHPTGYSTDPTYVFFGNSLGITAQNDTTLYTNDTLRLDDATAVPNSNVPIASNVSFLLARLVIDAVSGVLAPAPGDSFTVSLVSAGFNTNPDATPIDFTSTAGTILVTPEPGTLTLMSLATGGVGFWTYRRRKKNSLAAMQESAS